MRRQKHRLTGIERRLKERGWKAVAGVDEAGRGPLAGPVVAGAVILKTHDFSSVIDDSKRLTKSSRERAYDEIFEKGVVGIGIADEKVIDEVNIYQATRRAMSQAVSNLNALPDYIIIDGNIKLDSNHPQKSIVRGDSKSISIAAASIVAKVTRDRIMDELHELYPQYGFKQHKGYPTKSHKAALALHGPCPIHRRTFRPVKDLC